LGTAFAFERWCLVADRRDTYHFGIERHDPSVESARETFKIIAIPASVSLYRVYRTHRTEQAQRQAVAQTLDSGIEGRLTKSVAEIAKSTGADPGGRGESLANHINAEKDRLRAAGYYDTL
jgi:hypothetical protein